eukprot:11227517-Lingulodinium_polyedra.AAC.1
MANANTRNANCCGNENPIRPNDCAQLANTLHTDAAETTLSLPKWLANRTLARSTNTPEPAHGMRKRAVWEPAQRQNADSTTSLCT